MKKLSIIGAATVAIACSAFAMLPTFLTKSASGTTAAAVIFPQDPTSQIRVVSAISSSDLASSTLSFYNGTTATSVAYANTNTAATNIIVASTNGFVAAQLIYLQGATSNVVRTVNSLVNATNISVTGAVGIPQVLNAEVEILATASPVLGVGATTNKVFASDGLVVGNYGRCLYVKQTGTSACTLDAITVHYDSAGN